MIHSFLEMESNLKPIWLSGVICADDGSSPRLADCSQRDPTVGYAPCNGDSIVAVSCGEYVILFMVQLILLPLI